MRALIISAALLAAVVTVVFSSAGWLSGFFSELLDRTDGLPEDLSAECAGMADALSDKWYGGRLAAVFFFDKAEVDNVDRALNDLASACASGDEKEYTAAKKTLRYEIKRLYDMTLCKPENVL